MLDIAGIIAVAGGIAVAIAAARLLTDTDSVPLAEERPDFIPPPPGGCDEHGNYVDPAEWAAWWRELNKRNKM